jgi:glutathione synthase/RimK-type ligase-like ATP-grasp enzyme
LEAKGVRVIPTRYVDARVRARLDAGEAFVLKPVRGERGHGVHLARRVEDLAVVAGREGEYLAQEFMPDIRRGERSLVFLGFEYQLAVMKRPAADRPEEFRCNESLGGTVEVYEPTPAEIDFAAAALRAYESPGRPVRYSRIDLIETDAGPALMEAELINPAAFANYSGKGRQFGESLARYLGRLLAGL